MKKTFTALLLSIFISATGISVAYADTHVSGVLRGDIYWDATHSPYIFDDYITVPAGSRLNIGPGVTIAVDPALSFQPELLVNGILTIAGVSDKRALIHGIGNVSVIGGTTTISYADFDGSGLSLITSHADISSSTFSGAWQALYMLSASVKITASRIENNSYGAWIDNPNGGIFQANSAHGQYGTGGIGNALDDASIVAVGNSLPSSQVTIVSSSIVGNSSAGIRNTDPARTSMVQAAGNWWGSPNGPVTSTSSAISGYIAYEPWLDHDPMRSQPKTCCSSILFIPGLEGTRLYRDQKGILGSGIGRGTSTNTLWEPNRNDDVRALFLNSSGASIDKSIYSGDPIGSAWTNKIYSGFMRFLDGLATEGKISQWKPYGYDWRKPVRDVVAGSENKGTATTSLIQTVIDMSARSKTGKVSIVAHSNGGLVAKELIRQLASMGKSNLIDSLISVAVPYLGTPEAVAGILHGDDESLAHGLILKQSVARQLGQNMASAYSLLPSKRYFSAVPGNVISFATGTPRSVNNGSYPKNIDSFSAESAFISDAKKARSQPDASDTDSPIIGNASLLASASALHDALDVFVWPQNIARWAIVGWDMLTTKGIEYHGGTKPSEIDHDAVKTNMGDGTVVAESASFDAGTTTSIDLKKVSQIEGIDISHANILESSTTQGVIDGLLSSSAGAMDSTAISAPGVSSGQPDFVKYSTIITVSTHSPVQLHVYDPQGRHVGEIAPPPDTEPGLFTAYETQIPMSEFDMHSNEDSDTDHDTYIYLPDDGTKYSVAIEGTGVGTFTFDIERTRGEEVLDRAEYADLPVTPMMLATTTIMLTPTDIPTPPGVPFGIAPSAFASAIQPLNVDIDGNGSTDIKAISGSTTDPVSYLEYLKRSCRSLLGGDKRWDKRWSDLSGRIDRLEDKARKGAYKPLREMSSQMADLMRHRKAKGTTDSDKKDVLDMLEGYIARFE